MAIAGFVTPILRFFDLRCRRESRLPRRVNKSLSLNNGLSQLVRAHQLCNEGCELPGRQMLNSVAGT